MSQNGLAARVEALEKEVAHLRAELARLQPRDWRSTIGMFSGDEGMKEIMAEALKIREKDREKARKAEKRRQQRVKR